MSLKHFILESIGTKDIENLFDECINKYYPQLKNKPKPKFSIMYNDKKFGNYRVKYNSIQVPTGHGGYTYQYHASFEEISINKDILNYPEKLKSVVWHETIHFADTHLNRHNPVAEKRMSIYKLSHTGFFEEQMNRINNEEGTKLISVMDKYFPGQESTSDFFVHVFKCKLYKEKIMLFWTSKNDLKTQDLVKRRISNAVSFTNYYVFQTKNAELKILQKLVPSMHNWKFNRLDGLKELNPDLVKQIEQNIEKHKV